jgi:flagellar biosynthesis/type III secretory pathway protein FliH
LSDEAQLLAFHDLAGPLQPDAEPSEFTSLLEPEDPLAQQPQGQGKPAHEIDVEAEARRMFEEAFAQGERAGHEMGMKKVEPLIERLNQYLGSLDSFKQELLGRVERFATLLALTFAEAIVLKECRDHREVTLSMIRKALEACEERSEILVRVPKEDAWLISAHEATAWTILPDEELKEPGFVIETKFGNIDGRISKQLEELKTEFLAAEPERG